MGEICAKCGKNMSFFDRHHAQAFFAKRHPEFNGKKLCNACISEIVKKECNAYNEGCGVKRYGPSFSEALEQGRRIVVVKDAVLSADGIGKHIEIVSKVAEKYGYTFKSETHFPDSVGIACSFIFEKIIPTANGTNFIHCTHCTSRYDANQYLQVSSMRCPSNLDYLLENALA